LSLEGRAEVLRRRQRLKALFRSIDDAGLDAELTSHYSRYLCVLVSGYAEQSIKALAGCYCEKRSERRVHRYAAGQLSKLRNFDLERLRQLVQGFSPEWWDLIEDQRSDDLVAFTSVAAVRNAISHGTDTGITIGTITQYFDQISRVLDDLCVLFDPVNA